MEQENATGRYREEAVLFSMWLHLGAVFVTMCLFPQPPTGGFGVNLNSRRLASRHFRGINDVPYGLPLIYSTFARDAAPSLRLFLLPLSPPPWGSLQTKEAQHDDEDSQQKRPRAVHR